MLQYLLLLNRLDGTMINMKDSSATNSGLHSRWGHINDLKIGICCFSTNKQHYW